MLFADRRFAIVSNGRTASYWLAGALDAHPQISCGHSKQNPPIPDYYGSDDEKTLNAKILEVETLPSEPEAYYKLLKKCGRGPFYGTVHTYSTGSVAELNKADIKAALLTRHPVTRTDSYADRRKIEMEQSEAVMQRTDASVSDNLTRFPKADQLQKVLVDVDPIDRDSFLSACFDIGDEANTIDKFQTVIQSERITSDPDYMTWFLFSFLGLTVTTEYLDEIYSRGKLNTLAGLRQSAFSTFSNWPAWKKETFGIFGQHYRFGNFAQHGYDVEGTIVASRARAWVNRDKEAIHHLKRNPYTIRNLGRLNPETIRTGSVIDVFVRLGDERNFAVSLGKKTNNTLLLHNWLPQNSRYAKISFAAPTEPGEYQLNVSAFLGTNMTNGRVVIDRPVTVSAPTVSLPDHGFLRMSVSAIA